MFLSNPVQLRMFIGLPEMWLAKGIIQTAKLYLYFRMFDLIYIIFFPQGTEQVDSAPGAPQERSSLLDSHAYIAEVKELQRRYYMGQTFLKMRAWCDTTCRYSLIYFLKKNLFNIRLDEEMQQRIAAEEQLMATQDRFQRYEM